LGGNRVALPHTLDLPPRNRTRGRAKGYLSVLTLLLTTLLGAWAFLYPFFVPPDPAVETSAHASDAPLIFLLVTGLCLVAIVADLETRTMSSKTVALLGVLVATNALIRPLQGIGGFSVFYLLPILCGYTFGGVFGFLLGALSLLVSAIFTGGVGPWLPFQMLAMGWLGLASGALPAALLKRWWGGRLERWVLAAWGAVTGVLFGVIMNLWFWPYLNPNIDLPEGQIWQPGAGLGDAVVRYAAFYLATSFAYDIWRSVGNALLLIFLAPAVLRLLRRFRQRLDFAAQ
jgi:energy-coupling factor transport system substrate-specific component